MLPSNPQSSLPTLNTVILRNTGKQCQLLDLLHFRNIIIKQLFLMSKIIVTKTLFDRIHYSMLIKNQDNIIIGGICYYEIKQHKCSNIIYFVIDPVYQAKGYGNYLMTRFKQEMRDREFDVIVAHADTISLNFYYKNGFIQFQKKNKKLDRQPMEYQKKEEQENKNKKYKKYQPWLDYIQDYYSSVLVTYRIYPKVDYKNMKSIISLQKQGLLTKLDGRQYRNHSFHRQQMQELIESHRQRYKKDGNYLRDPNNPHNIQQTLSHKQHNLLSSHKSATKLQQIALLKLIKQHPCSYILKLDFIRIPDSFHDQLSNLITIDFIQQNIVNDVYRSSSQLCAEFSKLFQNLKLFLAAGTNYYEACEKLEIYARKLMGDVMGGSFDVMEYFCEEQQK